MSAPERIWARDDGSFIMAYDFKANVDGISEYVRTDLSDAAKEAAHAAGYSQGVREAMKLLDQHDSCPCKPAHPEAWSDEAIKAYEAGQVDAALSWRGAFLALLDAPAPACPNCGGAMKPGKAMSQTAVGGTPDFPGDTHASTFSAGGPGKMIDCRKCEDCGWSVTGDAPAPETQAQSEPEDEKGEEVPAAWMERARARAMDALRSAQGAATSPDPVAEAARHLPNCIICKRIIDPREVSEGGDPHGAMFSESGDWVCSGDCWDRALAASPQKDGE